MVPLDQVRQLMHHDISRHDGGFFASSRLSQIRPLSRLQGPHLVFIRLIPQAVARCPTTGSQVARSGGMARRNCARCHCCSTRSRASRTESEPELVSEPDSVTH